MSRFFQLLLAAMVAAVIAYALFRQSQERVRLNAQLYQLHNLLTTRNGVADEAAEGTLKHIKKLVADNRNAPANVTVLRKAEGLHALADSIAWTLRDLSERLHKATGSVDQRHELKLLKETRDTKALLGPATPTQQRLAQQLAIFTTAASQLLSNTRPHLVAPNVDNLSAVAALASFSQLEYEIRATCEQALRQLSQQLDTGYFDSQASAIVRPFASAEASTVAPGDTYRATVYLATVLSCPGQHFPLTCNGQSVPINAQGIGHVRFWAPMKPGPAAWVGRLQIKSGGRDSVFQVRVPYRVARP
jgi:hypothetical protein